jgi:hypothetical protein
MAALAMRYPVAIQESRVEEWKFRLMGDARVATTVESIDSESQYM